MRAFRAVFPNRPNDPPLHPAAFNLLLIPLGFPVPTSALINRAWNEISAVLWVAKPRQPHLAVCAPGFGADLPELGIELGTDGSAVHPRRQG
jgi:hypothetical protein